MNYFDKSIDDIHEDLLNKKYTSKDLINYSLSEAKKINKDCNAFNLLLEEKDCQVTDNILSGIPYAMKDNISTSGIRTTACSNTLKDYVPIYDATIYKKLQDAGAVMIGKTNMDELAMGGTGLTGNTGIVRNPFDINRITAGSSAGSAVAVATKTVPFAIGTDTGDSIRKPAAYTGVVGYKPTYGLVSRYGLFAFASSLDTIGVLTNNVKDAAIVIDTIKGSDDNDMTTIKDMDDVKLTDYLSQNNHKKLFCIKEVIDKSRYNDENTLKILDDFISLLNKLKDKGYEIIEESIDETILNALKPIYTSISCAEATSNDSNLTGISFGHRANGNNSIDIIKNFRTENFSSLIKRRFVIGSFILQKEKQKKYFINAKKARRLIVNIFNELFTKYDGLIMPAASNIAPLIKDTTDEMGKNEIVLDTHLLIGNFGGYPSITIPYNKLNNMPVGINITSGYKKDGEMLSIANNIESIIKEDSNV